MKGKQQEQILFYHSIRLRTRENSHNFSEKKNLNKYFKSSIWEEILKKINNGN